jgi:integrase
MRYKASQAQELADHVIRDMSKLIPDAKTGKMKPAYAPATINRSLACAKKGPHLAWRQRLIPENYGLRIERVAVNYKREVFLTVDQVKKIASFCTPIAQAAIWAALLTGARRGELFQIEAAQIGKDTITFPAGNSVHPRPAAMVGVFPAGYNAVRCAVFMAPRTRQGRHTPCELPRPAALLREHHARIGRGPVHHSKILGHANVQTTQRYARLQVDAQGAALASSRSWWGKK